MSENEELIREANDHSQDLYKTDRYSAVLIARLVTALEKAAAEIEHWQKAWADMREEFARSRRVMPVMDDLEIELDLNPESEGEE